MLAVSSWSSTAEMASIWSLVSGEDADSSGMTSCTQNSMAVLNGYRRVIFPLVCMSVCVCSCSALIHFNGRCLAFSMSRMRNNDLSPRSHSSLRTDTLWPACYSTAKSPGFVLFFQWVLNARVPLGQHSIPCHFLDLLQLSFHLKKASRVMYWISWSLTGLLHLWTTYTKTHTECWYPGGFMSYVVYDLSSIWQAHSLVEKIKILSPTSSLNLLNLKSGMKVHYQIQQRTVNLLQEPNTFNCPHQNLPLANHIPVFHHEICLKCLP